MMRNIYILLVLMLSSFYTTLQADDVKVTLKSGSTITGELKELITTDHITLIIAGVESVISMDEVSSIEKLSSSTVKSLDAAPRSSKVIYGQYQITDTKEYPDSFKIRIGDQELTMVLVRGGTFNMGYDGRHSISWDSEPVHRVTLSSFYVSRQLMNCNAAETLLKKKKVSKNTKPYQFQNRVDVNQAVRAIGSITTAPYRLLTEAEWEYFSLMPLASKIFGDHNNKEEWCFDRWSRFGSEDQINPQGPDWGKEYVIRRFSSDNEKWKRQKAGISHSAYVRIAISADQIQ